MGSSAFFSYEPQVMAIGFLFVYFQDRCAVFGDFNLNLTTKTAQDADAKLLTKSEM